MSQTLSVTFLRHGRSRADDEQVHEGHYDSPLTDIGRAQARSRAEDFVKRGQHFDEIVASPLKRAFETATIIGGSLHLAVQGDPDWQEMNSGPLAEMSFEDALKRYPPPLFRGPYEPYHGSGESDWEVYRGAAKAIESLVRRGPGRYLVVAHGGILNAALRAIVGAGPFVNRQGIAFCFGDTGYARLMYDPARHLWSMLEFRPE